MAIQREQQYAVLARGIREMIREFRVDEALKAIESDRSIIKWAEAEEWTFALTTPTEFMLMAISRWVTSVIS